MAPCTTSPIEVLRHRTRPAHAALEETLGLTSPRIGRSGLADALGVMLGVWRPLERALTAWHAAGPSRVDWPARVRVPALEHDLALVGGHPSAVPDSPGLPGPSYDDATALGVLYVLDGSALGGRVIARHLEGRLPEAHRLRFLVDDGSAGAHWQQTRRTLDAQLVTVDDVARAAAAATQVFEALLAGARTLRAVS